MKKEYLIFAGVNGAGKTTLYKTGLKCSGLRINSDEILRENGGDWQNIRQQAAAMKEAVRRLDQYFREGRSFNQESTLTGNSIINNIKRANDSGYKVKVCYVGLESADLAIQRINGRVQKGGHGIPDQDVRRRYGQSLQNLKKIIPMCDELTIYDNTDSFRKVADFECGEQIYKKACPWLDRALED